MWRSAFDFARICSRVFYEASRDLDSPPSPRSNRVEACRPRGCFVPLQCSGGATVVAKVLLASDTVPARGGGKERTRFRAARGTHSVRPRPSSWVARPHTSSASLFAARSRVDSNLATAGAESNSPAELLPARSEKSLPGVPERAIPPLLPPARASCRVVQGRRALGRAYRRCHNESHGQP